jgi:hypothetical protein
VREMEDVPVRFRRLPAGDRGLIAAPWTPLASFRFQLRNEKENRQIPVR